MPLWIRILGTLLLAVVILGSCGAAAEPATAEQRLRAGYGDPAQAISSREAGALLLELVNAERAKHGLSRLRLSAPASKLAKQHADDMAAHGYVGHYDLEGRKCELRYNLLGQTDHVAENIAYREVGARVRLTPELVRGIFVDWMASKSHRLNIRHPAHTHMGYGFATNTTASVTKVFAVQEFVNDWGDFSKLPNVAKPGDSLSLRGTLTGGFRLLHVGLGWETPPGKRNPIDVGEKDLHYRQPEVRVFYLGRFGSKQQRGFGTNYPAPYPELYFDAAVESSDGSLSTHFKVPNVIAPVDLYVTVWLVDEAEQMTLRQRIADNFEKTVAEHPTNSFESEGPDRGGPFRVMTQVIRVEPGR